MHDLADGRTHEGDSPDPFVILGQYLDQDGWYPCQLEGKPIYRVFFNGKNGELRCYAQIHQALAHLLFYAVAPVKVPVESRAAVAEFVTRANYGMRIGNFEMDYSDGEVRYKSSLDFEGEALTANWIRNAIHPAVQTMDRYLNGLMAVVYCGKAPADAIADIEDDAD
jgi:hypothetical protein